MCHGNIYLGKVACSKDYYCTYYGLYGVRYSQEGNKQSTQICAFDSPEDVREYLNRLAATEKYTYYALYRITSSSPDNTKIELVSLFPNIYDIEYYCLRRMDRNSTETIIASIEANEESLEQDLSELIKKCIDLSSKKEGLYSCWHVLSSRINGVIVEKRTFINSYHAYKQKKKIKTQKKHKR